MSLKIISAKLKNFGKFVDFVCEFGEKITHLVGVNGSGKSTVGFKGLLACLNGISENKGGLLGKRFLFIGKSGKAADIEYSFRDTSTGNEFTMRRHITPSGQEIKFTSKSGEQLDDSWLRGFLNLSLMSAKNFCALSGREQALALGIDTSTFENNLKSLKAEYTLINRDIKNMGEIDKVEKVEAINTKALEDKKTQVRAKLNALYKDNKAANEQTRLANENAVNAERDANNKFNEEQENKTLTINAVKDHLFALEQFGYNGDEVKKWARTLPQPEPLKMSVELPPPKLIEEMPDDSELTAIDAEISAANENNIKARDYLNYLSAFAKKAAKEKELADNKKKQEEETEAMIAYINAFKFPFAGLKTDEDGGLVLESRPLNESYFSRGELEIIVAQLHASLNPDFKCRFIDDFDLIDDENQEKILNALLEKDFQIITAEVRKTKERENTLVLRECAIANDEEEKKERLL